MQLTVPVSNWSCENHMTIMWLDYVSYECHFVSCVYHVSVMWLSIPCRRYWWRLGWRDGVCGLGGSHRIPGCLDWQGLPHPRSQGRSSLRGRGGGGRGGREGEEGERVREVKEGGREGGREGGKRGRERGREREREGGRRKGVKEGGRECQAIHTWTRPPPTPAILTDDVVHPQPTQDGVDCGRRLSTEQTVHQLGPIPVSARTHTHTHTHTSSELTSKT